MTETGKRLIEAAQEAVAVANGEIPAAAIYHNGHKYVPAAELEMLTGSGIVEVAVRNPNVAEYMRHWESRALTAEAQLEKVREALKQHEKLLCINAVRDAARQTAPLWLEAADAAADRVRALSEPDKEGIL